MEALSDYNYVHNLVPQQRPTFQKLVRHFNLTKEDWDEKTGHDALEVSELRPIEEALRQPRKCGIGFLHEGISDAKIKNCMQEWNVQLKLRDDERLGWQAVLL